jgi:uptake hydrogenase large subunit
MSLEGELQVSLRLRSGTIDRVSLASTRPDVAQSLLQGRSRAEVQAALPVMFSLCGRSQATAGRLACAAAEGEPTGDLMSEGLAAVAAETVRELACHTLLHWPRWLGEEPGASALAAVRDSMAWTPAPAAQAITLAVFGQPAAEWLQLRSEPELGRWASQGRTPAARFIRHAIDAAAPGAAGEADAPWLPRPDAAWLTEVATALQADPGFARTPVHRGAAAETGSLARLQSDPSFSPGHGWAGSRRVARFVARLHELALLLDGRMPLGIGTLSLGDGAGIAWVDNARGLLLHQVRLSQGRVTAYHIVAPTEWNFHPQGPLVAALLGARVGSADEALALATQVVHSLDPCVACRVGMEDA